MGPKSGGCYQWWNEHRTWETSHRNWRQEVGDVIVREVESAEKEWVANKMATMIEDAPDDVLGKTFHILPSGVWTVASKIFEQIMLSLRWKNGIGGTLEAHIAKFFDTGESSEWFSKRMLTAISSMVRIATFVQGKTDLAMRNKKCSTTIASKEPVDTIPTFDDDSE